jgi:hypothetical protein
MSSLSGAMRPGTLVRSVSRYPSHLNGIVRLTPLNDPEGSEWPEWHPNEVGVVLPAVVGQVGVLVMIPGGIGICFHDEVKEIR